MPDPVPPIGHLTRRADEHFLRHLGHGFEALAGPLDAANPAGLPARATSVYRAIIEARQGDDDAQPRGVWQRQPKRPDWPHVSTLAAGALRSQGKDLQLAAWLCEAQVHEHGAAALAPCMLLLQTLCQRDWDGLHPRLANGQAEARANIIGWLNQKLIPTLRQAPLVAHGDGSACTWADWEQAGEQLNGQLNEQAGEQLNGQLNEQPRQPGATDRALGAALAATSSSALSEQRSTLRDALAAIDLAQRTFDDALGAGAPRLDPMASQVSTMLGLLQTELDQRTPAPKTAAPAEAVAVAEAEAAAAQEPPPALPADTTPLTPRFRNRADAYACLADAAAFLAEVEPHSPTPYLVKRAVEWGNMNTGALYQELFIRLGGQLSIFEMVGSNTLSAPPHPK